MKHSTQEPGEGLPVRGYEWRYVDWEEAHTTLRKDKPDRSSFNVDLEIERRLTGIDDVKALIQDKIEEHNNVIEDNDESSPKAYTALAKLNGLEELLEEIEDGDLQE